MSGGSSLSEQRMRLKPVPIDVWSTREKLALASSVARSGDQNWYSVSRPLKAFAEVDRPADWFSQKNCAIQYTALLEKVETPKRKRGERGEDTAQDLIVRKLTHERMDELKEMIKVEQKVAASLKEEINLLTSGKADDKFLDMIRERMKADAEKKAQAVIEKEKFLKEREAKFAAVKASKLTLTPTVRHGSKQSPSMAPSHAAAEKSKDELIPVEIKKEILDSPANTEKQSPESDPGKETSSEVKTLAPLPICPSTSPLLTSLLQSPSQVSPYSSASFASLRESSVSSDNIPVSTNSKQGAQTPSKSPNISSEEVKTVLPLPLSDASVKGSTTSSVLESTNADEPVILQTPTETEQSKAPEDIPASPLSTDKQHSPSEEEVKSENAATASIVSDEASASVDSETLNTVVESDVVETTVSKSPSPVHRKPKIEEMLEATSASTEDSSPSESADKHDLDLPDVKKENDEQKDLEDTAEEETTVTSEHVETDAALSNSEAKTPVGISTASARGKRRKICVPASVTPTATRRSGRVRATKEDKPEDQEAVSDTNVKKIVSCDEATDASMSEESLDAGMRLSTSKAPSVTESVPNSPASSIVHTEDTENVKEYKSWKKSIMLLWRQAATHKFASLFLHPVTDDEAKGYSTVVYRPKDLTTIRKKIENGAIRTTSEFQRDIMLMFQNAIMYNSADHEVHQMAVEMQKEVLEGIEDFIETQQQGNQMEMSKRGRRSGISTPVSEDQDSNAAIRRKSRTSTDTDPGATPSSKSKPKKKT